MLGNHLAPSARRMDRLWSVMDKLRQITLEAYDKFIGLRLADVAVDCCITKAPCGGEMAGRSPLEAGKNRASSVPRLSTRRAYPSVPSPHRLTAATHRCWVKPWTHSSNWAQCPSG
jgi:hypothetical protein